MTTRNDDSLLLRRPPKSRRLLSRALIPLLLVIVTIAIYCPILRHQFVGFDDGTTVYENLRLRHVSSNDLYAFWTSPQAGLYAPLTYSLFAVITLVARIPHFTGGMHDSPFYAWPFHAVSLLLHVLTVLVVYRLLCRLIGRRWPAAAGALLFSLHPVQVESVAWVTEINGLLCAFFSLSAVLLYLRSITGRVDDSFPDGIARPPARERWSCFILATQVFILAMLSKPLGVMVPALAAVMFWMTRRKLTPPSSASKAPWELGIWLVLAIPIAVIARGAQPVPQWWLVVPLWLRPLVAADALAFYVYKLLFPITLLPDYDRSPHNIEAIGLAYWTWIVPAILAVVVLWLWQRRRADAVVAGAIWFVVALLPVLGLTTFAFQRMSTVADRYLYLPMFGIALCVTAVLACITSPAADPERNPHRILKTCAIVLTVIVLAALALRTTLQISYWRDTHSLFEHSRHEIGRDPGAKPA